MRSARTAFFASAVASFLILLPPAHALDIQFCTPACSGTDADPAPTVFGPGTPVTDSNGVVTNSVSLGTFTHTRGAIAFTITGTITSQQSGTLTKFSFNPTTITVTSASPCSTTSPCSLEVMVTSDQFDFPIQIAPGGVPAGTYMIGAFRGTEAVHPTGPNDTISQTEEYAGTKFVTITNPDGTTQQVLQPIGPDIINGVPGGTGSSLPASCAGNLDCKFTATSFSKGFSTSLTETVQQQCDTGVSSCVPWRRRWVDIQFETPGNSISF